MVHPPTEFQKGDLAQFAPEVRQGLDQLARAFDYAQGSNSPLWDFAVELERLLAVGMTTSDLRWLIRRGYLSHAMETTASRDLERRFDPVQQNLAFAQNTCFILTAEGLAVLGRGQANSVQPSLRRATGQIRAGQPSDLQIALPPRETIVHPPCEAAIPNWDKDTRTLLVGEHFIKRFRVPSPNQEAVLEAFQEEGWPISIDDPLSPVPDQQPKRRLRDTIKSLNLNQDTRLIRFRGDGTGQRVVWEFVADSVSHVGATPDQPLRRAA